MTRSRDTADTQDNLGGAVAPYVGAKNFILNGSFDCWQRGTSIAAQQVSFNYTADRWGASSNTSGAANTVSTTINVYDELTVDVLSPTGNGLVVIVRVQE
jgi:hypothetical protein